MLYRAETRMGKSIPEEDLKAGRLSNYLEPEDYAPIQNVSKISIYLCVGLASSLVCFSLSDMFSRTVLLVLLPEHESHEISKNTSSLYEF